ncbi:dTDP-4-dehydrorhamnose reductase [Oceanospirillum sediminis]|uniref:dTDP-4-dehydrorhamnose reductase n=1 Tax=Oceanospirillum sediminis TaxID=2760088 RepID=A0A839IU65_9GAMM|nr:dTDP-4-dehydrorhamnose reductase [Oceanospirillum sediminis]MBB1488212.1 dTDP-4-dehydrorhamnose reductase [Oceanospirillum sediminis]
MLNMLITGADGQLGQAFRALDAGHCLNNGMLSGIELIFAGRQQLDITDEEAIRTFLVAHSVNVVVNAAAYTAVDQAESDREQAFLINQDGPAAVARACHACGVKLIHISTDYVFDGAKSGPYSESDAVNPCSVYGASKLAGEQQIQAVLPEAVILRTSWVFSEFGQNFLKTMLRLARDRDALSIVSDQIGGPTYAPHIARVCLQLAYYLLSDDQDRPEGVYHFSGQPVTSWYGFASEIFRQLKQRQEESASEPDSDFLAYHIPALSEIPTQAYPTPAARPANSALNTNRLELLLQESFCNDWKDGVMLSLNALARTP